MTSTLNKQRLLTPGPTAVPEAVLIEMAKPIIHHRTKEFQAILGEVSQRLQRVFKTAGPVLTIAGSGTTAFEAAQTCLAKPGSKALTIAAGKFGERWQDIYDAYHASLGVEQVRIDLDWGKTVDPAQVEQALKDNPDISVVTVVHSETSTATASDVKAIANIVSKTDALLIVDGITAVGALDVDQDAWGIDVLVTGSQKALMLPPGLGFVGLGERALKRLSELDAAGHKVPQYNLDLRKWVASHAKNDVPFTPPVNLIRGQRVALEMIENEGVDNVVARTSTLAAAGRAALQSLGLKLISENPSDSVTGAFYPEGVKDSDFRAAVRDNHGIHIAGGQSGRGGEWKGKIFRISHMGYVDAADTLAGLMAIEAELLATKAIDVKAGTAVSAASAFLG